MYTYVAYICSATPFNSSNCKIAGASFANCIGSNPPGSQPWMEPTKGKKVFECGKAEKGEKCWRWMSKETCVNPARLWILVVEEEEVDEEVDKDMAKEVDKEVVEELAVNVKGNMCKSRQTMNTCHTEMVLAFEEYHPHRKFSQIQSFKNNLIFSVACYNCYS